MKIVASARTEFTVRLAWLCVAAATVGAFAPGCDVTRACTAIGCVAGVSGTIVSDSGALPDGEYTLTVTIDGDANDCTFSVPSVLADGGVDDYFECGEGFEVDLRDRVECTEQANDDSVSQACTPVPNTTELHFTFLETPDTLGFSLRRDGEVVLDDEVDVDYTEVFPNGPDCGGGCDQATLDFSVE